MHHAAGVVSQRVVSQAGTEAGSSSCSVASEVTPINQPLASRLRSANLSQCENDPASSDNQASLCLPVEDDCSLKDSTGVHLPETIPPARLAGLSQKFGDARTIDADPLSSDDMSLANSGLDPAPPTQTDPPWSQLDVSHSGPHSPLASVRSDPFSDTATVPVHGSPTPRELAAAAPSAHHSNPTISASILSDPVVPSQRSAVSLPNPRSPFELRYNLFRLLSTVPRPPPRRLLAYHAAFPHLHSASSYNILMAVAIRNANFGTVDLLLKRMKAEGIRPNLDTRKLRVRWLVRVGKWDECWDEESARAKEEGQGMPLTVWLEFFDTTKRGAIRRRVCRDSRDLQVLDRSDSGVTAQRHRILMQSFPSVTTQDWASTSPRVVFNFVRAMIRAGERSMAAKTTRVYFDSLPPQLDDARRSRCLEIIHLHMAPRGNRDLSEHYRVKKDLFAFLRMHRTFEPTSTTLFMLLRTLQTTTKCGSLALSTVQNFVSRWGAQILDRRVRRRLVSLALKQNNLRLMKALTLYLERLGASRKEEQEALGRKSRRRALSLTDTLRFTRRGTEGWRWRLLRRRLWRFEHRTPSASSNKALTHFQ
ncbi:hypothetical protein SCP_0106610 [Sparassis crispa]|uniref:Pentatricopeptide repeat-containing protein n=1 Tax=Sparassis crispa TaxID=139825 RepID=A0A401G6J9_9APHY|nr:hypothetical protein SCP_0106610 [Sparassis crispa]GBE77779.1 hypothetical protein SCP_0106610 [Sparassis crispa]